MVGSGGSSSSSSSARGHGVDRFYNPPAVRRQLQLQQQQQAKLQQQRQQSPPPPPQPQRPARSRSRPSPAAPAEGWEQAESRVESDDSLSKPSVSSSSPSPPPRPPMGNLDRFLEATTPLVPAEYFPKRSVKAWRNCDAAAELPPYFLLEKLWESFKEWSAYGAGVPLVLNESDYVVQYYVPYLSAIQLYVDPSRPTWRLRRPGEDSDEEPYLDTSSDGSSEIEADRLRERSASLGTASRMGQEGFLSDDADVCNPANLPVFEYLERDPPYGREPLADKISILASKFPDLKMYKSCDLLPSSWMSVAWYPIYRIPTGPTLKDLDACFLTFHSLATPSQNIGGASSEFAGSCGVMKFNSPSDTSAKLTLPVFGLVPYKLRGSIWTPNGLHERQVMSSLLQAADNWLRLRRVDHPDYRFFMSHFNTVRW